MVSVVSPEQAKPLGLPGRTAFEIMSGAMGASNASVRLVEIAVPRLGEERRGPHVHHDFEECIYVLAGEGRMLTESDSYPMRKGDMVLIPAGEPHVTRNTGPMPLLLLCFFPTPDVGKSTENLPPIWK